MADNDENANGVTAKEFLIHALLLVLLLAALFPGVFLRGETVLPAALLYEHPPWRGHEPADLRPFNNPNSVEAFILFHMYYSVAKQCLAVGEWPLWNPLEFSGIPLLANYQSAIVYPPRILHALLDIPTATTVFLLLKLWFAGALAYMCARYMALLRLPSTFVSIAWMLSGYHISWVYHAIPDISAWLPLLLLSAEMLARNAYRRAFFTMALAGVLLLLSGHPESAFTGAMGVGFYFLIRKCQTDPTFLDWLRSVQVAGLAWGFALGVCAIQILPFWEYLVNSQTYAHRVEESSALHFYSGGFFPIFWVPRFFGAQPDGAFWADGVNVSPFMLMAYAGIPTFLGIALLLASKREMAWHRDPALAFILPSILFLLFAFRIPEALFNMNLPIFGSIWGSWFLVFPMMSFSFLAGIGYQRWSTCNRRAFDSWPVISILIVVAVLIGIRYYIDRNLLSATGVLSYLHTQLLIAATLTIIGTTLAVLTGKAKIRRPAMALLCCLLAFDLLWASRGIVTSSPREHLFPVTPLVQRISELSPPARINTVSARILTGTLQPFGVEEVYAYDGILPARMWDFLGNISGRERARLEALTSAEFYLHDPRKEPTFPIDTPGRYELLDSVDRVEIYRDTHAFPRAYLANRLEVMANSKSTFDRLLNPDFDPRTTVLTEEAVPFNGSPDVTDAGTAHVNQRTFNCVRIEVNSKSESILVLTDAYFPGWKATVDGVDAAVFPTYRTFRGIVVPQGSHTVEFRYQPKSFRIGAGISVFVLFAGLLMPFVWRAKKTSDA